MTHTPGHPIRSNVTWYDDWAADFLDLSLRSFKIGLPSPFALPARSFIALQLKGDLSYDKVHISIQWSHAMGIGQLTFSASSCEG